MGANNQSTHYRLWSRVIQGESGCWLWTGVPSKSGYGYIKKNGKSTLVHKLAYEEIKGPIAGSLTLDHVCREKLCVNPAHLELVTIRENILRGFGACGINRRKTACIRGHLFTPENTYRASKGGRACRTCALNRALAYRKAQQCSSGLE